MHMVDSDFQTLGAASILTKQVAAGFGEPEQQWNGLRIFELAKQGNAVCVQAIDGMCDVLGKGIANICYVMNPQVVVLGGGIMAQEECLKERIENAVADILCRASQNVPQLSSLSIEMMQECSVRLPFYGKAW